jgi:hypothetical protein
LLTNERLPGDRTSRYVVEIVSARLDGSVNVPLATSVAATGASRVAAGV